MDCKNVQLSMAGKLRIAVSGTRARWAHRTRIHVGVWMPAGSIVSFFSLASIPKAALIHNVALSPQRGQVSRMVPRAMATGPMIDHGEPLAALCFSSGNGNEKLLVTAGGISLKAYEYSQKQGQISHKHIHAAPGVWVGLATDLESQQLCAAQSKAAHLFRLTSGFRPGPVLRMPAEDVHSLWPAWQKEVCLVDSRGLPCIG